jgi:preprotein translocase subunit SecG
MSVGVLAFFAGQAAEAILHTLGYVALGVFVVVVLALAAWALHRRR